ncbi:MAG: hypothetical protein ACLQOO_00440 [Terriglobia bacterium]
MAIITLFKRERPGLKLTTVRRPNTRLARRVAITLSGTDTTGRTFREHCYTVVVSRVGAKVETMHDLPVGAEITIENQELGRASKGNVVWTGGRGQSRGPNQIGICLIEAEDFWGLGLPPEVEGAIPQPAAGEKDLHDEAAPQPLEVAPESCVAADSQTRPEPQTVSASNGLIRPTLTDPAPQLEAGEASGDEHPEAIASSTEASPASLTPPAAPLPDPALQATLMGFATKVQDAVETHSALFEQKLVKAADDVVARTEADLHRLAEGLEKKARAEFTVRLGTIETRSKLCEEQLVQVADDVLARTEASLQGVASNLGEKAKNELAESVETIETRLQETVTEAEAVLPKLHDASRYELAIQKARQSLAELTSGAVEFALEEVNEVIDGQIRPVALNLVAETRQRIEQEATSSLEALLHGEGANRLHQWFTEGLQAHEPAVEAKFQEALESCHQAAIEKANAQFESLIQQGAEQARQRCEEAVGQTLEAMNQRADEVARGLNERVEQVELRLSGLLAEATSQSEAASAAAQQQADELGNRVLERIQKESGVLVDAACDRMLKANEFVEQKREEVVGQTLGAMNQRADEVARELNESVGKIELRLNGLLAEATSHLEAASAALQKQADELGDRVLERIQKESGVLVDAACDRMLKANELVEQKREEAVGQALEAMNKGASDVARGLNEGVEQVGLRLSGLLAEATSHSEAASAAARQQADELGNRVLERIQKESGVLVDAVCDRMQKANEFVEQKREEVVGQALGAMNQRADEVARELNESVGRIELRLNGLLVEATSHLEAASVALQKQADELGGRVLERIQKESGVLVDATGDRMLKAHELVEQKSVEAAESRIKAMIQGLTASAQVHLQAMVEGNGREFVDLLTQNQARLVTETAAALRAKIAETLMAMQRSVTSEAPDRGAEAPSANDAGLVR